MKTSWIKLFASFAALALLIIHLVWDEIHIDTTAVYLLIIGIVPWFASMFETFEMPGGWKVSFRAIRDKQDHQQAEIATLKFLIGHFLTEAELIHLTKLTGNEPFSFQRSPYFENEMRHLRALGFIAGLPGRGIRTLFTDSADDVKHHFEITARGKEYLNLRRQSELEGLKHDL